MKIIIKNASVSFGVKEVLSGVDFEINERDKIAIVGRNGCGKTTLLKLICGEVEPDKSSSGEKEAEISISNGAKIGYLEQISFEDENVTLEEEVLKIFSEVLKLKQKLRDLESKMATTPTEKIINEYIATEHNFELKGGYTLEKEYSQAIESFGFSKEERSKKLCEFSGGQKTKIALIKLLFLKPDVLILDEPTNHLDVDAVGWLEEYLTNYPKAVIVVSHDRAFLDRVASIVVEVENKTTHKYIGNYSAFVKEKKEARERQQKEREKYLADVQKLQAVADRFRYKATKASMAQAKLKQIERMEEVLAPEKEDIRPFRFNLKCESESSLDVVKFDKLKFGYNVPLGELTAKIFKGDRVAIVGGNGLGKSTILKTLMGKIAPLGGKIKFGQNLNIGYFDQQTINLIDSEETVIDSFLTEFPALPTQEARRILGGFLFTQEDVFKSINSLSGGERVRFELAKIFNHNPNFLILDEPTNHLDILGRETLEDILLNFKGTILFVSHDRFFVNKLATGIISLEKMGCEYFANTTYSEYLKRKPSQIVKEEIAKSEVKEPAKDLSAGQKFKQNKELEKKISKLERAIKRTEEEIGELKSQYESPENCSNVELLMQISDDISKKEAELDNLMSEWLEATSQ